MDKLETIERTIKHIFGGYVLIGGVFQNITKKSVKVPQPLIL